MKGVAQVVDEIAAAQVQQRPAAPAVGEQQAKEQEEQPGRKQHFESVPGYQIEDGAGQIGPSDHPEDAPPAGLHHEAVAVPEPRNHPDEQCCA